MKWCTNSSNSDQSTQAAQELTQQARQMSSRSDASRSARYASRSEEAAPCAAIQYRPPVLSAYSPLVLCCACNVTRSCPCATYYDEPVCWPPSPAARPSLWRRGPSLKVRIGYLGYRPDPGPLLSNVIPEPEDAGLRGAELAITDSNSTGRFLKHSYVRWTP